MPKAKPAKNRYQALIEMLFFNHYKKGAKEVLFDRSELVPAAKKLGFEQPKNLGDVIYSQRFRSRMPKTIIDTQPEGFEWIIEGAGRSQYAFRLAKLSRIVPNESLITIKIPDATPEIIRHYALSDEQALLAKVRYNRLIDIFIGIAAYSLQSHLRTSVTGIGQIEIDEIYVGVDKKGRQFVVPVQAKGGSDNLSPVQAKQDIAYCAEAFSGLICRAISAQFVSDDLIALFELTLEDGTIKVVDEVHYRLVPADRISVDELRAYGERSL